MPLATCPCGINFGENCREDFRENCKRRGAHRRTNYKANCVRFRKNERGYPALSIATHQVLTLLKLITST